MLKGLFDFETPLERPKWYICLFWACIGASLAGILNYAANITGLVEDSSFRQAAQGLYYVSPSLPVLIVLYCFATPLIEELLFRYFIFNLLYKYTKRAALSIVICAALFGLYHLNPLQIAYGFLMGLLITYSYYRHRILTVPFLVHAAANAVALAFTFL